MTKTMRARYTLEFKKEAVRLVEGGQSIAAAARTLGLVEQTELAPCMTGHGLSLIFEDRSRTVSTNRNTDTVEVIMRDQRRRRWSLAEKSALVKRTYEPGMSVSLVARQEGVAASLLFQWRKLERQGALMAVSAGESVVPASELAAARAEIAKLQRVR